MIKKFIDCYIPVTTCNLKCHYCYISQLNAFEKKLPKFNHTPKEIATALTQKRLGGPCMFNLCGGGETLIPSETIEITYELLKEGHYVMIVTNGLLTKQIQKFKLFPKDFLARLFFKFSFHYLELKRLNAFDCFFNNIKTIDSLGCSFTVELTANDEYIPFIDDIKEICVKNVGAPCHVSIGRKDNDPKISHLSSLPFDEYCKIWENFNSGMFDFKKTIFYKKRKEFCYAGLWSININLENGNVKQCYGGRFIDNIFNNINKPIAFCPVGINCTQPHCYNGHAFLTFGNIPDLDTPTYLVIRDKKTENGMTWVKPEMKKAFESKLVESNELLSPQRKIIYSIIGIPHYIIAGIYNTLKTIKYKNGRKNSF